jgi:hypothetical protein
MPLSDNIKILMPLAPVPTDENVEKISAALEVALTTNVRVAFVPTIGVTFLASLSPEVINPFTTMLSTHLDTVIGPIISAALAASPTVGGPIMAWASIQPSFDALALAAPPFMAGLMGLLFWQAILTTIRLAILPPIPSIPQDEGEIGPDGRRVVLRIDR